MVEQRQSNGILFLEQLILFKKMENMSSSSNLSHLAQKRSTQSFKKEIETRKKKLSFPFLKIKNVDSFKSYKGLKLNVEKA